MRQHCRGSGVPGDIWEHGHHLVSGTEWAMFAVKSRDGRTGSTYFQSRCRRCDSTARYGRRIEDKAGKTYRTHRDQKYIPRGFASGRSAADARLQAGGFTIPFLTELFRASFGKPCPGLCFTIDGTELVPHLITDWSDLQLDWRDPRYPLTADNCGELCATCNQQKGDDPWPVFMERQRAIRINVEQALSMTAMERALRADEPGTLFSID